MECVLCQAREESYRIVYEDRHVFVLANIEPLKFGHLMVLPHRHIEALSDLNKEEAFAFNQAIDRCMNVLAKNTKQSPFAAVQGWGFRSQKHLHAQVLPTRHSIRSLFAKAEGLEERTRAKGDALKEAADELRELF